MDLRHLRYFIAVAEELHFGRAAERLAMAQPPLSQQIRALERELGVTLFHRTKRQVLLSEAGTAFLPEARRVLAAAAHAAETARRAGRGEIGSLRIGFVSSAAYSVLPVVIRAFRERYPDVQLDLKELSSDRQQQGLAEGILDIGFARREPLAAPAGPATVIHQETVLAEPFVVALPEAHPLAGREPLALSALAGETFITFPRSLNPGFFDQIVGLCQQAGFTPRIGQEAMEMPTIVSLVSAGIGVALVPASMQRLQRAGVVYRPLPEPAPLTDMIAAWRTDDRSPTVAAFVEVLRQVVRQLPGGL